MHSFSKYKRLSLITFALCLNFLIIFQLAGCSKTNDDKAEQPVIISGVEYPVDTEQIILNEYDSDDYSAFSALKKLHTLDITALDISSQNFDNIRSQIGDNVNILWSVPLSSGKMPSNSSELSFSGDISEDDANLAKYFTEIKKLIISDSNVDNNLYTLITDSKLNNPELQLQCKVKAYGVTFKDSNELLDLNNVKIKDLDLLCLVIELFPNLTSIEMCNCGLSNEVMQGLREEYPQIKFVWMIKFLRFRVRTDIQVFSTLAGDYTRPGNSNTFAPLFKYCTELRALDIGHMALTDISEIRNLKKLHTLILADNYIEDISPLADLKELVYVEIFQNSIKDASPLLELPKLEELNLCFNPRLKNPTILTSIKTLKRLYISYCSLDQKEINALESGVSSDCELNYTAQNCVFGGWRSNSPRNPKIREAFANWRIVKEYPTWDNIVYKNTILKN